MEKIIFSNDLFFLLENFALSRLGLLSLDSVEELVVQVLRDIDLADVDLGRRGHHVDLIDSSEWATVEFEWTRDKQEA